MKSFELVDINVSSDVGDVSALSKDARQALVRALNLGGRRVTGLATTEVASRYFISKGQAKKSMVPMKRATVENPVAVIRSVGSVISLYHFRTNPKTPPSNRVPSLNVAVKRGEGMKPLPGAFIAKHANNDTLGVFIRRGSSRLPIDKKYGPSVPGMLKNEQIVERLEDNATEWVAGYFDGEMLKSLQRRGK